MERALTKSPPRLGFGSSPAVAFPCFLRRGHHTEHRHTVTAGDMPGAPPFVVISFP